MRPRLSVEPGLRPTSPARSRRSGRRWSAGRSLAVALLVAGCGGTESRDDAGGSSLSDAHPVIRYSQRVSDAERRRAQAEALQDERVGPAPAALEREPRSAAPREPLPVPEAEGAAPEGGGLAAGGPSPAVDDAAAAGAPDVSAGVEGDGAKLSAEEVEARVAGYLGRLRGEPDEADDAYRELWEVDARLIWRLIAEVENPAPTRLEEIDLLVRQKDFARYSEEEGRWYYFIKGMGRFEFDDIAARDIRRGRAVTAARVRLRKFDGFPLGVVVRGALLNRFRSVRFPLLDDGADLVRWWREFYYLRFGRR